MSIYVCLLDDLFLRFYYNNLTWQTGAFELASAIISILQIRLTTSVGAVSNGY